MKRKQQVKRKASTATITMMGQEWELFTNKDGTSYCVSKTGEVLQVVLSTEEIKFNSNALYKIGDDNATETGAPA